jgi:hypothetical protein
MKGNNIRGQVVRDFARLSFEDSLPDKVKSTIVEAAIHQEVTIREMLRETVNLEAFGLHGKATESKEAESEEDLVHIYCPS